MENQKLLNIYLYPYNNINKTLMKNPYQENFIKNIENHSIKIINSEKKYGILDIFKYFTNTDIFYFNFTENLPERKFGLIQSIIFPFIFLIIKISGKKTIWVLHNKVSHTKKFNLIKRFLMILNLNFSDKVFTLCEEGIDYGKKFIFTKQKIKALNHPVENQISETDKIINKDINILIWGLTTKYKGVDRFLEFVNNNNYFKNLNITIVGQIPDKKLKDYIFKFKSDKINIIDSFISDSQLVKLHSRSEFILFTYLENTVLSSAALMKSVSLGSKIIGPNCGAFKDLAKIDLIKTYDDYEDIEQILSNDFTIDSKKLSKFMFENSWSKYAKNIAHELRQV